MTCERAPRGIGEWAGEIENGAEAQRATEWAHGFHRRVIKRGEKEHEAGFAQAGGGQFRTQVDGHAKRFQHVRGTGPAR